MIGRGGSNSNCLDFILFLLQVQNWMCSDGLRIFMTFLFRLTSHLYL